MISILLLVGLICVFLNGLRGRFFLGLVGKILLNIVKLFFLLVVGICCINGVLGLIVIMVFKLCIFILLLVVFCGFNIWFCVVEYKCMNLVLVFFLGILLCVIIVE